MRKTRITLAVALLASFAVLAWLAAHPSLFAGHISRLITRNLLREAGATFVAREIDGSLLSRIVFRKITITRAGDDGSFLYATADSLVLAYDLQTALRREPVLDDLELGGLAVLLRKGPPGPDEEDAPPDPDAAPLFDGLPRLTIGAAAIRGASMSITAADGSPLQELTGIDWGGSVRPVEGGLLAHTHTLHGAWPSRALNIHRASCDAVLTPDQLDLRSLEAVLDSTRARADLRLGFRGTSFEGLDLTGYADEFLLDEIMRLIGQTEEEIPRIRWTGDAELHLWDEVLRIEAVGEGWVEDARVGARRFVGILDADELLFEEVEGYYRSADGRATGRLDIAALELTFEGQMSGADLSDRWAVEDLGWPESDLAGDVRIRLDLGEIPAVDLQITGAHGTVLDLPVDSAAVDLRWSEDRGLDLREGFARSWDAEVTARGTVDTNDIAELLVMARADSLDDWARYVQLPIRGQGLESAGRLHGPIDSLSLRLGGTLARAESASLFARDSQVLLEMPRVDIPERLRIEVDSPAFGIGTREIGALVAHLDRKAPIMEIERLRVSVGDSTLRARGRVVEIDPVTFGVEVDSLSMQLGADRWTMLRASTATVDTAGFATPGLEIVSDTGRFAILGGVSAAGDLDLQLQIIDGELGFLERVGVLPAARGDLTLAMQVGGTVRHPLGALLLEGADLEVSGRRADRLALVAEVDGAHFSISSLELDGPAGHADVAGGLTVPTPAWLERLRRDPDSLPALWRETFLALRVRSQGLHADQLVDPELADDRFGRLDAEVVVSGHARAPELRGHAAVFDLPAEPFVLPRIEGDVFADSTGVRVRSGSVDLGGPEAKMELSLPLILSLAGPSVFTPENGATVLLDTVEEVDLAQLPALWSELRDVSGRGRMRLHATGDLRHPRFTGEVAIRDATVGLEGWSERLRDLHVEGALRDSTLYLTRIEAREGANGRLEGTGEVTFRGLLPDDIVLRAKADRVLVASVPFLRAVGTSNDLVLTLERPAPGSPRAPKITGTAVVDKALYTGEFATVGEPDPALLPTTTPEWMADLRIRAQDQVRISNASAELRVQGDVSVIRDTGGLRFRGTVEVPQGRVPLFNNDFAIVEGTLDFSRRPVEPEIDIVAVTEVPISDPSGNFGRELERITVYLTGTFSEPTVRFESENGLEEQAILRLLAGFDLNDTAQGAATAGLRDVGLRAGLNFLERALATQIVGIDTIDIETQEAGLDQMGGTRIAVGKYLSNSLYLRYAQGLSVTERDIFLEYQISRRTLFTSELKRRLRENGAENEFNLDFKFRVKY